MSTVMLSRLGSLDLLDLDVIGESYGRDFMPYPFMYTQPSRFVTEQEALTYAASVRERFKHGDLTMFRRCARAYQRADIRVECHIQHIPADVPSERVLAYRARQEGYFAVQRPESDTVDIYTVSAYDLGAAICDAVTLTRPGRHERIVIPKYAPRNLVGVDANHFDADPFIVRDREVYPIETIVADVEVSAYATVQCHWRPARNWGLDHRKQFVRWVSVNDDGDYIYAWDQSHATPMIRNELNARIDRLITDDILDLLEFRGEL